MDWGWGMVVMHKGSNSRGEGGEYGGLAGELFEEGVSL